MHGLALRAVQLFVEDLHGASRWTEVIKEAGFDFEEFEAMLDYDDDIARETMAALERVMGRPLAEVMEDLGTYLVSHPNMERLRRLLRFGGVNFTEFLHSLDDLPARVRLPNFELPSIELREHSASHFSVTCRGSIDGFGHVLMGILRTMADDYGALVLLEYKGSAGVFETLSVTLIEDTFAEGREFNLGAMVI